MSEPRRRASCILPLAWILAWFSVLSLIAWWMQ